MNIFCFSYAGGSASTFLKWRSGRKDMKYIPVELAGRGNRYQEELYTDLHQAVRDLYESIKDQIESASYAFFGHSMGALIIYELAHYIIDKGGKAPVYLFLSGKEAPNKKNPLLHVTDLPDISFQLKMTQLGGIPSEIFENKSLADIFLPILKSDLKIVEEYSYKEHKNKLSCDFMVFYGDYDLIVDSKDVDDWKLHTTGKCNFKSFEEGHFFLNDNWNELISIINRTLLEL